MEQLELPSIPILVLSSFLFLLILFKKGFIINSGSQTPRTPPGPWLKLPLIGSIHCLIGQLPFRAFRNLARRHGPLMVLRIGQVDFAVVSSREAAEEILKLRDPDFASRPQLFAAQMLAYGCSDIAFSPYGPYWRQLRKLCFMELLSAKRISTFSSIRKEETLNTMREIAILAAAAAPAVNLNEKIFALTNNIVSRAAFGKRSEHQDRFIPVAREAVRLLGGLCVADTFPSLRFLDVVTGAKSRLQRLHRELDEIIGEIIKEHDVKVKMNDDEVECLVDVLLRLKEEPELEIPMTEDNLKAVIFDMFVGGTETSSSVLEWVMSELMRHPKAMEKAQKEVREAVKGKTTVEDSDVVELNYIRSIIKETLRLHPAAPLLQRVCTKTCEVLGYKIEVGTRVFVNIWAMGRDPQYWDDAEGFRPERFQGDSIDFKGFNFEYLPFGAGRRICPGMGFGMATVELVMAQLLFYFDWKLPHGMKAEELDMSETFGLTAPRKTELKLNATPHIPIPHNI